MKPNTNVGLISKKFDAASLETNGVGEEVEKDEDDKEMVESVGIITRLDESMPKGIIERTYFFDIATFCRRSHPFKLQSQVKFKAFRSKSSPAWVVTSMELHISKKEEQVLETRRHKTLVVKVERVEEEYIEVKWGENKFQRIPKTKELMPQYPVKPGKI